MTGEPRDDELERRLQQRLHDTGELMAVKVDRPAREIAAAARTRTRRRKAVSATMLAAFVGVAAAGTASLLDQPDTETIAVGATSSTMAPPDEQPAAPPSSSPTGTDEAVPDETVAPTAAVDTTVPAVVEPYEGDDADDDAVELVPTTLAPEAPVATTPAVMAIVPAPTPLLFEKLSNPMSGESLAESTVVVDGSSISVAGGGKIHSTVDGSTWTSVVVPSGPGGTSVVSFDIDGDVIAALVRPSGRNQVWADQTGDDSPCRPYTDHESELVVSLDGGETWMSALVAPDAPEGRFRPTHSTEVTIDITDDGVLFRSPIDRPAVDAECVMFEAGIEAAPESDDPIAWDELGLTVFELASVDGATSAAMPTRHLSWSDGELLVKTLEPAPTSNAGDPLIDPVDLGSNSAVHGAVRLGDDERARIAVHATVGTDSGDDDSVDAGTTAPHAALYVSEGGDVFAEHHSADLFGAGAFIVDVGAVGDRLLVVTRSLAESDGEQYVVGALWLEVREP